MAEAIIGTTVLVLLIELNVVEKGLIIGKVESDEEAPVGVVRDTIMTKGEFLVISMN